SHSLGDLALTEDPDRGSINGARIRRSRLRSHENLGEFLEGRSAYLDSATNTPMYRRVRAMLEDLLARGVFDGGRPMPSTRYLAQELGVSRNTVAAAYDELIALGVIES